MQSGHLRCCTVCGASFRTDFLRCPLDGAEVVIAERDPLIGTTFGGHYQIDALIGVGAMGRVYRAHHTRLVNKRYALKVLFGELTASATMRMRFAHEAESASKLEHPNIVDVLDFGCTDTGLLYLVMDLVDGPTLGALIDKSAIPPSRVVSFARQLCLGLAHAHARGIIHRDFKPDNILVSGEPGAETLRIADFGLAISIAADDDADARLTGTGVMCTPAYAAPEQMAGRTTDHRADLYALGVTMYEMLTGGVLPFARSSHEVMLWKVTAEWPEVATRAPRAPAELARLIRRLLACEPSERPASAQDVIQALDALAIRPERAATPRWRRRAVASVCVALPAAFMIALVAGGVPRASGVTTTTQVELAPAAETIQTELAPSVSHEPVVPEPAPDELDELDVSATVQKAARKRAADVRARANVVVAAKAANVRVPPQLRIVSPAEARAAPPEVRAAAPPELRTTAPDEVPRAAAPPSPTAAPPEVERVVAPAPPRVTAPPTPRVIAPQTQPVALPPRARPARPPRIVNLEVSGALTPSVVRRAIERVLPALHKCTAAVGSRVVTASFAIDETRRAVGVRVGGTGAPCVTTELVNVRSEVVPDVGRARIEVRFAFDSGS